MTEGELVMAVMWVVAIGIYVASAIHLWKKPTKLALEYDEQQSDERSQRGRY